MFRAVRKAFTVILPSFCPVAEASWRIRKSAAPSTAATVVRSSMAGTMDSFTVAPVAICKVPRSVVKCASPDSIAAAGRLAFRPRLSCNLGINYPLNQERFRAEAQRKQSDILCGLCEISAPLREIKFFS